MESSTILHNISPEQINNLFKGLQDQISELQNKFEPKQPTEYLTRAEVSELLKCDLSTLWNWQKKGKLIAHGIGNRIYYKRSEIEASIIPLNK